VFEIYPVRRLHHVSDHVSRRVSGSITHLMTRYLVARRFGLSTLGGPRLQKLARFASADVCGKSGNRLNLTIGKTASRSYQVETAITCLSVVGYKDDNEQMIVEVAYADRQDRVPKVKS